MKNDLQFYPTPPELARKMRAMLHNFKSPLLEPSAGNGDLLDSFFYVEIHRDNFDLITGKNVHCVELDETRVATLKGKGWHVVWNDFMTFNPVTPYKTIIMNPPFNAGALHLLKAIAIAAPDAEICCLLNAETIRNPYNRVRQELLKTLEAQAEYKCEFVSGAFDGVNVETAIVYVRTQPAAATSFIFEHFKRAAIAESAKRQPTDLQPADEVAALLARYRVEVKSALALYDEVKAYQAAVLFDKDDHSAFKIEMPSDTTDIVRGINEKYWRRLFGCESIQHLLTSATLDELHNRLTEMREYEFSEYNILNFKIELAKNLVGSIDAAIMSTWEAFTHKFSMDNTDNIHYYNGWKTNKAFACKRKVILPIQAFESWGSTPQKFAPTRHAYIRSTSTAAQELSDIEKALNYLDTGRTIDFDMMSVLKIAQDNGTTRGIDTHFFTVDCFKKGTVHLTFKSAELLKKFNLYCGRRFNWLPPSYGTKPYSDLTPEEKSVADSFEGEQSYNDTYTNRSFYLADTTTQLLLE